jgi:prepilin-type N-terminal cleavage/methylation domain-containing protein
MKSRGFSMIELLVTVAIMSIMSAIVFFNSPKLNRTVYLNRAAREVAFALRVAQAKAVQIKTLGVAGATFAPNNFSMEFRQNSSSFKMFSDEIDGVTCSDKFLDTDPVKCPKETAAANQVSYTLQNGVRITNLRVQGNPVSTLNILFYRPDPTTYASTGILVDDCYALTAQVNCTNAANGPFEIDVALASDPATIKTIQIWLTGQISIR